MMILRRKVNQCTRINDDIEIKIVAIRGYQVQIGISAPQSIPIHRAENYAKDNFIQSKSKKSREVKS